MPQQRQPRFMRPQQQPTASTPAGRLPLVRINPPAATGCPPAAPSPRLPGPSSSIHPAACLNPSTRLLARALVGDVEAVLLALAQLGAPDVQAQGPQRRHLRSGRQRTRRNSCSAPRHEHAQ